jgi:branched-chain amino acid transport system permease protein
MYILIALGFALLFSIMELLHVAHGVIYMLGGYICYSLSVTLGINQWLSLVMTVAIVCCFGPLLERFFFRPFFRDFDRTLLVGIGISTIIETTMVLSKSNEAQSIHAFASGILKMGPVSVSNERLVTFLIGALLLVAVMWLIHGTKVGLQMQAVGQDLEASLLQGINIHRISALACVIACGLAAVAGSLLGAYMGLGPFMGDFVFQKALVLVVLGGIGSIGGIFVAGLVVGGIDAFLPLFISGSAASALAIGIVIVVLLLRPKGFFGREMGF